MMRRFDSGQAMPTACLSDRQGRQATSEHGGYSAALACSAIGVWLFLVQTSGAAKIGAVHPNLILALFLAMALRRSRARETLSVGVAILGAAALWVPQFLTPVVLFVGAGVVLSLIIPFLTGKRLTDAVLLSLIAAVLSAVLEWQSAADVLTHLARAGGGLAAMVAAAAVLWLPLRSILPER